MRRSRGRDRQDPPTAYCSKTDTNPYSTFLALVPLPLKSALLPMGSSTLHKPLLLVSYLLRYNPRNVCRGKYIRLGVARCESTHDPQPRGIRPGTDCVFLTPLGNDRQVRLGFAVRHARPIKSRLGCPTAPPPSMALTHQPPTGFWSLCGGYVTRLREEEKKKQHSGVYLQWYSSISTGPRSPMVRQ